MSNINQAVERGVKGEALAALHGLHAPPDNEPPCDIDDGSHVDDQETLRGKIVSRLIQIESTVSRNRDLPDDVKQKVGCHPAGVLSVDANGVTLLRDLRRDINRWQDIDPESALSLLDAAIGAVATMIEIYRERFYNR